MLLQFVLKVMKIYLKEIVLLLVLTTGTAAFPEEEHEIQRQSSLPPVKEAEYNGPWRTPVQILGCIARHCLTQPKQLVWRCAHQHCPRNKWPLTVEAPKKSKRWQFSDPLQVCIHQECKGEIGATFYTCVYSKCIKGAGASGGGAGGGGGMPPGITS